MSGALMVRIIATAKCIYCERAISLLTTLGIEVDKELLDTPEKKQHFLASGYETVPQIFVGNTLIGGYDQLKAFLKEKILDLKS